MHRRSQMGVLFGDRQMPVAPAPFRNRRQRASITALGRQLPHYILTYSWSTEATPTNERRGRNEEAQLCIPGRAEDLRRDPEDAKTLTQMAAELGKTKNTARR